MRAEVAVAVWQRRLALLLLNPSLLILGNIQERSKSFQSFPIHSFYHLRLIFRSQVNPTLGSTIADLLVVVELLWRQGDGGGLIGFFTESLELNRW